MRRAFATSNLLNQIKWREANSESSSTSIKESPAYTMETERRMYPSPVSLRDIQKMRMATSDYSSTISTNSTNVIQELHTTDEHGYEVVCSRTIPGIISEEQKKHIYE